MPRYHITREFPNAGDLTPDQLQEVAAKSNAVLVQMGGRAQWVHSYVTGNHLFCIYYAESEEAVREHARIGGFPCNEVRNVGAIIDPVTGEN